MATDLDASDRICPPLKLNLCPLRTSPQLDHPSVPRSRRVQREQEAWEGKTFFLSLTARCVVGKGQRSLRRNDAPNTMQRCVCSLPPGSLTVARVPDASHVKDMTPPPKNLVVSALSCIPCLSQPQKSRLRAFLSLPLPLIPSSGVIGHAASLAEPGWSHLVTVQAPPVSPPPSTPSPLSRAERAHWRMTWQQRLARNARPPTAPPIKMTVYGLSAVFAQALGLRVA